MFPQFGEEVRLILDHDRLHSSLQNLYYDYMSFCIAVVRYIDGNSSSKLFRDAANHKVAECL